MYLNEEIVNQYLNATYKGITIKAKELVILIDVIIFIIFSF